MNQQPPASHLDIPGTLNLRDLGGRVLQNGTAIRPRRVLRSGHYVNVTEAGWAMLRALGIRTVFDLREAYEIEAMPSSWWSAVRVVHVPLDEHAHFDNRDMLRWQAGMPLAEARAVRLTAYRRKPLEFAPVLKTIFHALADESAYPMIFHCMGGKDRTGFTAAVILAWLGVSRPAIVRDYMLSADAARGFSPEQLQRLLGLYRLDQSTDDVVRAMVEVQPEYIAASLDAIEELGGIHRYLGDTVGVDTERLDRARRLLLATSSSAYATE